MAKNYIGETKLQLNGYYASIMKLEGSNHITIRFEDGTIIENQQLERFRKGTLVHPNGEYSIKVITKLGNRTGYYEKYREKYIGLRKLMIGCNQMATIVTYRSYHDIDVLFEDGTLIEHKYVDSFNTGEIDNFKKVIGEEMLMKNGQKACIIDYRHSTKADIKFEDGTIRKNVNVQHFRNGKLTAKNFKYNGLLVKHIIPNTNYYLCESNGKTIILSYDEMDKFVVNG